MITAGMDTREERQRGSRGEEAAGGKKQRCRHANIDKYFIPQHTESVRLGPRRRAERQGGEKRKAGQKENEKAERMKNEARKMRESEE